MSSREPSILETLFVVRGPLFLVRESLLVVMEPLGVVREPFNSRSQGNIVCSQGKIVCCYRTIFLKIMIMVEKVTLSRLNIVGYRPV